MQDDPAEIARRAREERELIEIRLADERGDPIDTSDIPEITEFGPRPERDASGRLVKE